MCIFWSFWSKSKRTEEYSKKKDICSIRIIKQGNNGNGLRYSILRVVRSCNKISYCIRICFELSLVILVILSKNKTQGLERFYIRRFSVKLVKDADNWKWFSFRVFRVFCCLLINFWTNKELGDSQASMNWVLSSQPRYIPLIVHFSSKFDGNFPPPSYIEATIKFVFAI